MECYLGTLCRERYDYFGWYCRWAEVEVGGQLGYYIYSNKDDGGLDSKGRKGKM